MRGLRPRSYSVRPAEVGRQAATRPGYVPQHFPRMRRLALLAGGLLSSLACRAGPGGRAAAPTPPPPVFALIAGTWDWAGKPGTCRDNPHTLRFTPDGRYMLLTFAHPVDSATGQREVRYALKGHTERSVRAQIVDEPRRTPTGAVVVWDLVLFSPSSYRWHRTDWAEGAFTPEVIRCLPRTTGGAT